jgi:hypothetical protein
MPVNFKGQLEAAKHRGRRGRHFDAMIATLAPAINGLRSAGIHDIRKLAASLNDAGIPAPSGRPFTYSTLRRVLVRMRQLHLGSGPRTLAAAATQRPARPYKFRRGQRTRLSKSALENARAIDPSF